MSGPPTCESGISHSAIFNLAKTPLEGKSGSALSGALVSISTGARLGLSVQHGPGPDAWNKFVQPQLRESGSAPLPDAAAAAASRLWLPSVVIGQSNSRRDRHEERGNDVKGFSLCFRSHQMLIVLLRMLEDRYSAPIEADRRAGGGWRPACQDQTRCPTMSR